MVSVRASSCYLSDNTYLFVQVVYEKRKTHYAMIRLRVPDVWARFVAQFLALGP